MKVLLSMGFLMKNLMGERTIFLSRDKNVKERKATIHLIIYGKFYGARLTIKMNEEMIQLFLTMRPDDTSIIYKPFPKLWLVQRRSH